MQTNSLQLTYNTVKSPCFSPSLPAPLICLSLHNFQLPHPRASLVTARGCPITLKINFLFSCSHSFSLSLSPFRPIPLFQRLLEENIEITAARAPGRVRREKRGQTVKRAGIQGRAEREAHMQEKTGRNGERPDDTNVTLHAPTLQPTVRLSSCVFVKCVTQKLQ